MLPLFIIIIINNIDYNKKIVVYTIGHYTTPTHFFVIG